MLASDATSFACSVQVDPDLVKTYAAPALVPPVSSSCALTTTVSPEIARASSENRSFASASDATSFACCVVAVQSNP